MSDQEEYSEQNEPESEEEMDDEPEGQESEEREESLPSGPEQEEDPTFVEIPLKKYQKLQERGQERDEYLEQLRRVTADYDNYQKRMRRKRSEEKKYAARDVISSLLPVLDDFDQALPDQPDEEESDLVQGMRMIYEKLIGVVEEQGVEQIGETDQPFDPNRHEAATYVEDQNVEEQRVVEVLRKGYKLHDQILRPARVIIARPPSNEGDDGNEA